MQLHGDDVYFTLDNCSQDEAQQREGVSGTSTVLSKVKDICFLVNLLTLVGNVHTTTTTITYPVWGG